MVTVNTVNHVGLENKIIDVKKSANANASSISEIAVKRRVIRCAEDDDHLGRQTPYNTICNSANGITCMDRPNVRRATSGFETRYRFDSPSQVPIK